MNFHYYLHELRGLSLLGAVKKVLAFGINTLLNSYESISAQFQNAHISDESLMEHLTHEGRSFQSNEEISDHFRDRSGPMLLLGLLDKEKTEQLIKHRPGVSAETIIAYADRICSHEFELMGAEFSSAEGSIDWHQDFRTDYRWSSKKYYKSIAIPYGKADIKVPWELSRFQYASTLGQAYQLTNDEKYAREFVSQIEEWIDKNRYKFGVNWKCTMDVAIRACNWIAGYHFFKESPGITNAFLMKFLKSLYQHGTFIRSNLEVYNGHTSNHYIANLVGLVYIGTLFPEFKEADEWREFGIQELVKEMDKQVYDDGCDYEASTCYHRLVLELFFYATLVAVINDPEFNGRNHREMSDRIFGKEYADKLHTMFDAVLYLLKPNGMMPQIGDNDSGVLHTYAERDVLDVRYLLTFGAIFFRESRFKVKEFGFCEEALWVFGEEGYKIWNDLEENALEKITSNAFSDAGWYVMRHNKDYVIISCGQNGSNGKGAHTHNDKLSFELCMGGTDIIVDPGTYVYTVEPATRNLFRSTAYHNTVTVQGLEQNRIPKGNAGLFRLHDDARAHTVSWESTPEHDRFTGEHSGFDREGFHHQRTIQFNKKNSELEIRDMVSGDNSQSIAYFHLNPLIEPEQRGDGVYRIGNAVITFRGFRRIDVIDSLYSPEYGVKEKNRCLKVHFDGVLETDIAKGKMH